MTQHIKDPVKGWRIWTALVDASNQVLTFRQLVRKTAMTPCQVRRGLRFVNHELQEAEMQPVIYSDEMGGYWLPDSYNRAFVRARLSELLSLYTRLRTANARNRATVGKFGVDRIDARIQRDFDRLEEDLSDVIEALEVQLADLPSDA